MNTHRVEVFHITNGDCSVICVTHYFVFNFFKALNTLFNQHLIYRRERKGVFHETAALVFIVGKTAACTAQGKCRAKNNGITDFFCHI